MPDKICSPLEHQRLECLFITLHRCHAVLKSSGIFCVLLEACTCNNLPKEERGNYEAKAN